MKRIAIVNRGEPAVRFLRALYEYNEENQTSMESVALYTTDDEHAPFVHQADRSISLGPAMRAQPNGKLISAYCDHQYIIDLLKQHDCDAIWPGWGFISEDYQFVALCEQEGITFIGPSSDAMRRLGDKISSKYLARSCAVPMAPWLEITEEMSVDELATHAQEIGFPLMIKASAGGGGRGIRKVHRQEEFSAAVEAVREEVAKVFGQGSLFMEACITHARHIEVQLVADAHGEAYALGVRDCSIQRRNQKVIEESPSPILPSDMEEKLCHVSVELAKAAGYVGVGTAEFLYQPTTGRCSFLEVNSRLQVEHTITELVTDSDLVKAQIDIALGKRFVPPTIKRGHAIELRLNAEDPEKGFQPSPGLIEILRFPSGPGLRIDSGVMEGNVISPNFDSMIAKIIIWAPTRKKAIARARRACQELDVVVKDGATNQAFLFDLLQHPAFVQGTATTAWLDSVMQEENIGTTDLEFQAILAAGILEYTLQERSHIDTFLTQVQDGIPQQNTETKGTSINLRLRNQAWDIIIYACGGHRWIVECNDQRYPISFEHISQGLASMEILSSKHKILYSFGSSGIYVEVDGNTHMLERASGGIVRAPSPAVVVGFQVQEGDLVHVGDRLCTLEAMKMEMGVYAQESGVVRSILCRPNQQVSVADPLLIIEKEQDSDEEHSVEQEVAHIPSPPQRWVDVLVHETKLFPERLHECDVYDVLSVLRSAMLGYDIKEEELELVLELLSTHTNFSNVQDMTPWKKVVDLLEIFIDCSRATNRNHFLSSEGQTNVPADICFVDYCRQYWKGVDSILPAYLPHIRTAMSWYDVDIEEADLDLRRSLWRLSLFQKQSQKQHQIASALLEFVIHLHELGVDIAPPSFEKKLQQVAEQSNKKYPFLRDNAWQAQYILYYRQEYSVRQREVETKLRDKLSSLVSYSPIDPYTRSAMNELVRDAHELHKPLYTTLRDSISHPHRALEILVRRFYSIQRCHWKEDTTLGGKPAVSCSIRPTGSLSEADMIAVLLSSSHLLPWIDTLSINHEIEVLEIFLLDEPAENTRAQLISRLEQANHLPKRCTVSWFSSLHGERHHTFQKKADAHVEHGLIKHIHPEVAERLKLWRLDNFNLERLAAHDRVYAFKGVARNNPKDQRVFVFAEVFGESSSLEGAPIKEYEQVFFEAVRTLRRIQSKQSHRTRFRWNWMEFYIHPIMTITDDAINTFAARLRHHLRGLSVREVLINGKVRSSGFAAPQNVAIRIEQPGRYRLEIKRQYAPIPEKIPEMSRYDMRVLRSKKMKYLYPYEAIDMLIGKNSTEQSIHPDMGTGTFIEYDLNENMEFVSVEREKGLNTCGVVCGIISNKTPKYPQGMSRVWIASDATRAMGALSEPECRRIIAAFSLAKELQLPIEWLPISSGAKISMESGTENLDWTASVLKTIVQFTQEGGFCNIIVHGINVGAQSYWNAEATMLMHTKGALIMTLDGSMVLTGKKALDYSGGISAEDERGIGGVERIMSPNGQAQFVAQDLGDAYRILFEWYRCTYKNKSDKKPRTMATTDPADRSILSYPYTEGNDSGIHSVGDIFDRATNAERKKAFHIRSVMKSVIDQDIPHLERFSGLQDGESAVIWESHIGGHPACLIGVESRQIPRQGRVPMDGPEQWTGGTLFPNSSRKVARAINAASGNRPIVVLANLSGFDGSPESLRRLQLEYGAEIGRSVVNFKGPLIFIVIGRYHGGAYVVFSKALNPNLKAFAVQGSFASVIGGAPAAAVVFPREVRRRVEQDPRIQSLILSIENAKGLDKLSLRKKLEDMRIEVELEKQGQVAKEFDEIHSVERAVRMGSLDGLVEAKHLRQTIIKQLS